MDIEEAIEEMNSLSPSETAIETILSELKKQDEEIKYWKEQAEGYQGLAEQIKEDFENRDRWE